MLGSRECVWKRGGPGLEELLSSMMLELVSYYSIDNGGLVMEPIIFLSLLDSSNLVARKNVSSVLVGYVALRFWWIDLVTRAGATWGFSNLSCSLFYLEECLTVMQVTFGLVWDHFYVKIGRWCSYFLKLGCMCSEGRLVFEGDLTVP